MKLTFFIGGLYGGGAERVCCNLASFLSDKKHDIEILSMAEEEQTYPLNADVKVTPLIKNSERKNGLYNFVLRYNRLRRYMKSQKEVEAYVVMLPITTIMMLMLRGKTKSKLIASERVDPNSYPKWQKILLKKLAKRCDAHISQTDVIRSWYGNSLTEDKAKIIPNAINPDFLVPPYDGERKKNIVAVGRLNPQKNFKMLINAFNEVQKSYPDYTLTIYGKGAEEENLKNQVAQLGLTDKIKLPGQVNNVGEVIKDSAMFVLSSDYEGMPNALMEAMALGLPCISADCGGGGARALINNGENGLLIPIGDCDALIKAMTKLLEDKAFAEKISKNAVKIQQKLAPDVIYGKWEQVITDTVNK